MFLQCDIYNNIVVVLFPRFSLYYSKLHRFLKLTVNITVLLIPQPCQDVAKDLFVVPVSLDP